MLWLLLISSAFIGTAAFAWRRGEGPERYGAVILCAIFVFGMLRRTTQGLETLNTDAFGFAVDTAAFAALVAIALFAWRIWPIWAASLQLLAVVAHLIRAAEITIHPLAYGIMRAAPTYLIWLVLLLGTASQLRLKRVGNNGPCWRSWSRR